MAGMHRSTQQSNPFFRWLVSWLLLSILGVSFLGWADLSVRAAPQARPLAICPDPIIAKWTFSNVTTPSAGIGNFAMGSGIGGPTYPSEPSSDDSPSISFNRWNSPSRDDTDFIEFTVDSTEAVQVSFKYSSSSSGPTTLELHYSTDGGSSFIQYGDDIPLTRNTNYYELAFDLSSINELHYVPNVKFKLFAYGASTWNGTLKIDNVMFSGYCPPPPLSILISEVAWAGTAANTDHEWIELRNPGAAPVDITGWSLQAADGNPNIPLSGTIPPGGYLLLERNEDAVADIAADIIYNFNNTLANSGETLILYDPASNVIDVANSDGGAWPAGNSFMHSTMERIGELSDSDSAWFTNNGSMKNGEDAEGNLLWGTPKGINSSTPTTTPTITLTPPHTNTPPAGQPLSIVVNEVAWAGTKASSTDEWIELYNPTSQPIDLSRWSLKSSDGKLSISTEFDTIIIGAGEYLLLERTDDDTTDVPADIVYSGSLSNDGVTLRLYDANGSLIDTANGDGGNWPAGIPSTYSSMQRSLIAPDSNLVWVTYDGTTDSSPKARDAGGNNIMGTPGRGNLPINVTATFTPKWTSTPTVTSTPTRTVTPLPGRMLSIVINEIAWAGTKESSTDEWIELYNTTNKDINIKGWKLRSSESNPSLDIVFKESILRAGEYLLLERTTDDTTDVPADIIFSGSLSNTGESLQLYDANGSLIDTANGNGGAWPAGLSSTYSSMQRSMIATDSDRVWVTYEVSKDSVAKAKDAGGNDIMGTPGRANRPINVTATSTPIGTASVGSNATPVPQFPPILGISEFLPRPGFDWNNDGSVDAFDEFIEIINAGKVDVNLSAYQLDDEENRGSVPYTLPKITLKPGERAVFFASQTGILLSDAGDTVRLLKDKTVVDAYTYSVARFPDRSWCRLPDRLGYWNDPCFPTPNSFNTLTGAVPQPSGSQAGYARPVCLLPDTAPREFVYAECEVGGKGIWNRQHWDQADAPWQLKFDAALKWETVFE